MLNCANQILLERRIIPPAAGECCWQTVLCCQPFLGIAFAGKSMPKVMSLFWIQLLNYTERRSIKAWDPHPNWEQLSRTTPSPTSPLAKPCFVLSLLQVVIPRVLLLKLIIVLHCNFHPRICLPANLICNNMKILTPPHILH